MNDLKDEGYRPMDIKDLVKKRLEALASGDEEEIDKFVNQYLDSSTGIVTYGDEIKIIPNCEMLENIDRNPELYHGGIKLTEESYNQLEGKTFNREDLILNEFLTEKEAREHPIWKELVGEETLNDYVDAVFDFVKEEYGEDEAMGVYIHKGEDVPVLRSCGVYRFGDGYDGSFLGGNGNLRDYGTRLVGVKDAEGVAENFEGVLSKYSINSPEELDEIISAYKKEENTISKRVKNFFSRK